jgi:hypothetical protein
MVVLPAASDPWFYVYETYATAMTSTVVIAHASPTVTTCADIIPFRRRAASQPLSGFRDHEFDRQLAQLRADLNAPPRHHPLPSAPWSAPVLPAPRPKPPTQRRFRVQNRG